MRVTIEVTAGPARGRIFNIDHSDLFIVGRARDSRISLPNDPYLSRQHFVVEICPPHCKITDLGSKNGTFVNGLRYGGKKADVNVPQAPDGQTSVVIRNGEIVVGDTRMKVRVNRHEGLDPVAPAADDLADDPTKRVNPPGVATKVKGASPQQVKAAPAANGSGSQAPEGSAKGSGGLNSPEAASNETSEHLSVPKPPLVPAKEKPPDLNGNGTSGHAAGPKAARAPLDDRTVIDGLDDRIEGIGTGHTGDEAPPTPLLEHLVCAFCSKECANEIRAMSRIPGAEYVCHDCRANRAFAVRERQPRPPQARPSKSGSRPVTELDLPPEKAANLTFPGYKVIDVLGSGGMGVVYKAVRQKDGMVVAIKSLLPNVPVSFENYRIFHREIEVTSKLKHPNIVEVLDHGRVKGAYFCVLEFVDGMSLKDFVHQMGGKLTLKQAAPLMLDILAGLSSAHHAQIEMRSAGPRMMSGIVHRDLKPENILLKRDAFGWTPKIADFGIAKNFEAAGMTDMTIAGVCGTPTYWPREQLTHYRYLHPATDVFSIAAVFYEMLTGRCARPGMQETLVQFQRRSQSPALADFMRVIGSNPIPPIREVAPELPQPVAAVLDKALQECEVPVDEVEMRETLQRLRYPDAGVFRAELSKALKQSNHDL